jgi:erythromycin esterase
MPAIKSIFLVLFAIVCVQVRCQNNRFNPNSSLLHISKYPENWQHTGTDKYEFNTELNSRQQALIHIKSLKRNNVMDYGEVYTVILAKPFIGKLLTLSCHIKTDHVKHGFATPFLACNQGEVALKYDVDFEHRVRGTTGWTRLQVEYTVPHGTDRIGLGVLLRGTGDAWFDSLRLEVDHKAVNIDSLYSQKLSDAEFVWLSKRATAIQAPVNTQLHKSLAVDQLIGNARYIALGESTHGTSEQFIAKGEIIKSLILSGRIKVVAFEEHMAEADLMDDCLQGKRNDIKNVLGQMNCFPWYNTEVLDLLQWIADYNKAQPEDKHVHFVGIDMQRFDMAVDRLLAYAKRSKNQKLEQAVRNYDVRVSLADIFVKNNVITNKRMARKLRSSGERVYKLCNAVRDSEWVNRYGRMIYQSSSYWSTDNLMDAVVMRDSFMAENLVTFARLYGNKGTAIWAHNAHVANMKGFMGNYLRQKFRDSLCIIGFDTDTGSFSTSNHCKNFREVVLPESNPQCYEYYFRQLRPENFILDLRHTMINDSTQWLKPFMFFRDQVADNEFGFFPYDISNDFDMIFFIRRTSPSHEFREDGKSVGIDR